MKRLIVIMFLSAFVLTSCSFGSPRIGGRCNPDTDTIAENSHGQPLYCDGEVEGISGGYRTGKPNPNYKKWTPYYPGG